MKSNVKQFLKDAWVAIVVFIVMSCVVVKGFSNTCDTLISFRDFAVQLEQSASEITNADVIICLSYSTATVAYMFAILVCLLVCICAVYVIDRAASKNKVGVYKESNAQKD